MCTLIITWKNIYDLIFIKKNKTKIKEYVKYTYMVIYNIISSMNIRDSAKLDVKEVDLIQM